MDHPLLYRAGQYPASREWSLCGWRWESEPELQKYTVFVQWSATWPSAYCQAYSGFSKCLHLSSGRGKTGCPLLMRLQVSGPDKSVVCLYSFSFITSHQACQALTQIIHIKLMLYFDKTYSAVKWNAIKWTQHICSMSKFYLYKIYSKWEV